MRIRQGTIKCSIPLALVACLLFAAGSAQSKDENRRDGLALKAGFDLSGPLFVRPSSDDFHDAAKSGISGTLEQVWGGRKLAFGIGVLGQAPRITKGQRLSRKLGFLAGYGLISLALPVQGSGFGTYATGRLGYSYLLAGDVYKGSIPGGSSLSGRFYWGASIGAVLKEHFLFEASFNAFHGESIREAVDWWIKEFEYRQFTLSIGFQF